jgi:hypothetical protein
MYDSQLLNRMRAAQSWHCEALLNSTVPSSTPPASNQKRVTMKIKENMRVFLCVRLPECGLCFHIKFSLKTEESVYYENDVMQGGWRKIKFTDKTQITGIELAKIPSLSIKS